MAEELKAEEKQKPRDPREWVNNDALMLRLEGQRIENPMVYSKITYPSHEWDNIPPVIPKFIIQLEKYMDGVTKEVKRMSELETVISLRGFTEGQIKQIDGRLKNADKARDELRAYLKGEIGVVDDFAKKFQQSYNEYCASLLYTKTVTQHCMTEEEGLVHVYKNYVLEESKPVQMGDQPPPASAMDHYKKQRAQAAETPRLMSVQGYQNLFDLALENSVLRKRQDETDE